MRYVLLLLGLLAPAVLPAAAEVSSRSEFLAKVREVNRAAYDQLETFICTEQIKRFHGMLDRDKAFPIDTVTASLSYVHGSEQYGNIQQNGHLRPNLASLKGAWSQGEFGTLLQQTAALLRTQAVQFERFDEFAATPVQVFSFSVAAAESPWELHIDGQVYSVPFRSEVWVCSTTGRILKLIRESTSLPAELQVSSLNWSLTLGQTELAGTNWLLPKEAVYEARYHESGRREWNVMQFSGYRRYSVDVAIRYDAVH